MPKSNTSETNAPPPACSCGKTFAKIATYYAHWDDGKCGFSPHWSPAPNRRNAQGGRLAPVPNTPLFPAAMPASLEDVDPGDAAKAAFWGWELGDVLGKPAAQSGRLPQRPGKRIVAADAKADAYLGRLVYPAKRAYAEAYARWLRGDGAAPAPQAEGLSDKVAAAVVTKLGRLLAA